MNSCTGPDYILEDGGYSVKRKSRLHPAVGYIITYALIFTALAVISALTAARSGVVSARELSSLPKGGSLWDTISSVAVICAGDVIQLIIISVASLTLPAPQICAVLAAWRGIATGIGVGGLAASGSVTVASLLPVISYFIASLFIVWFCAFSVMFSYRIRPIWGTRQLRRSGYIPAFILNWSCICAATVLIRMLPYIFIRS